MSISVPESVAFESVKRIDTILTGFLIVENLIMLGYFIYILFSTRGELKEKQRLAENDILTGVYNRNCFEERLHMYPKQCKESLSCIYIDVNGLHEVNNEKGHAAGDAMLCAVANTVKKHFGYDDTYRIGGDEFVAFVKDDEEANIRQKLQEADKSLTDMGYHISVGLCTHKVPVNIDKLIVEAEQLMYEAKRLYYEKQGIDRRGRR